MPNFSITITAPVGGTTVGVDQAVPLAWSWSVNEAHVVGAQFLDYRPYGSGAAWQSINIGGGGTLGASWTYSIPANTFTPPGGWELRVRAVNVNWYSDTTFQAETVSPSVVINSLGSSGAPTITSGATYTAPTGAVTWTNPAAQDQFQVQVLDAGGAVVHDSGIVTSSALTYSAPFPTTGASRTVQVRTRRSNVYAMSPWTTKAVTVAYTLPSTATVTSAVPLDRSGIGSKHATDVSFTIPSGSPVAITQWELLARALGDTGPGVRVASEPGGAGTYGRAYDRGAGGRTYQFAVRTIAADGRSATSSWVTATGPNTIRGVVLLAVGNPSVVSGFLLNGEGGKETVAPSSALLEYDGRALPVVEFGTMGSRTVEVSELTLRTAADRTAFELLANTRGIVLYRDSRGRKLYGVLSVGALEDTFYGTRTGLTVTAVDYPLDRTP